MYNSNKLSFLLGLLRLSLGWLFFWAFLDKLFGLNFATSPNKAWLVGGSPTYGFLKFATIGPFAEFYKNLAGNLVTDWLFMLGLFFVGITLLSGILTKLGSLTGTAILLLIYTAGFLPPKHNPFLDEHLIYILIMIILNLTESGKWLGLGCWWRQLGFVQKYPLLR